MWYVILGFVCDLVTFSRIQLPCKIKPTGSSSRLEKICIKSVLIIWAKPLVIIRNGKCAILSPFYTTQGAVGRSTCSPLRTMLHHSQLPVGQRGSSQSRLSHICFPLTGWSPVGPRSDCSGTGTAWPPQSSADWAGQMIAAAFLWTSPALVINSGRSGGALSRGSSCSISTDTFLGPWHPADWLTGDCEAGGWALGLPSVPSVVSPMCCGATMWPHATWSTKALVFYISPK